MWNYGIFQLFGSLTVLVASFTVTKTTCIRIRESAFLKGHFLFLFHTYLIRIYEVGPRNLLFINKIYVLLLCRRTFDNCRFLDQYNIKQEE